MKRIKSLVAVMLLIMLPLSTSGCAAGGMLVRGATAKRTPQQDIEEMAFCWTPDGKVAFYRRIDYWIKVEPDPFPGGGGMYDSKKNDEGFIVVRDPGTKEERVLFKVPFKDAAPPITYLDWSPVNGKLLLTSNVLRAIKPDGTEFQSVIDKEEGICQQGMWSPDGKEILYTFMRVKDDKYSVHIVNADGTKDRLLVEDGKNASWSPDGRRIVYQQYNQYIIYIINTDGTGKRLLLEGGKEPAWSPDGKWISWWGGYGCFLISPDGKVRQKVVASGRWFKDSKHILTKYGNIYELEMTKSIK